MYHTASWCRCLWVSWQLLRHFTIYGSCYICPRHQNQENLTSSHLWQGRSSIWELATVLTSYMLSPVITRKCSVSSNPAGHLLDGIPLFYTSERKLGCAMLFHPFQILFYSFFWKTSFKTSFHSLPVGMCFYHVCVWCMCVVHAGEHAWACSCREQAVCAISSRQSH